MINNIGKFWWNKQKGYAYEGKTLGFAKLFATTYCYKLECSLLGIKVEIQETSLSQAKKLAEDVIAKEINELARFALDAATAIEGRDQIGA